MERVTMSVDRKESKRWVAPKTSYDGDDWGDEYDQEDLNASSEQNLETLEEELESEPTDKQFSGETDTTVNPVIRVETSQALQQNDETPKGEATKTSINTLKKEEANVDHSSFRSPAPEGGETTTSREQSPSRDNGESTTNGYDLQDIYGYYEERSGSHPYAQLTHSGGGAEFSDSTASLSTGGRSIMEGRASLEYSSELGRVIEERRTRSNSRPNVGLTTGPHLHAEVQDSKSSSPTTPVTPNEQRALEEQILGSLNPELQSESTPRLTSGTDDREEITGIDATAKQEDEGDKVKFLEPDTSKGEKEGAIRPLSVVHDPELAALYQGTSEFLNRPISMYQGPIEPLQMRSDISDASIRDLLTPRQAQGGRPSQLSNTQNKIHDGDDDDNEYGSDDAVTSDHQSSKTTSMDVLERPSEEDAEIPERPRFEPEPLKLPSELERQRRVDSEDESEEDGTYESLSSRQTHPDGLDEHHDEDSSQHVRQSSDTSGSGSYSGVSGVSGLSALSAHSGLSALSHGLDNPIELVTGESDATAVHNKGPSTPGPAPQSAAAGSIAAKVRRPAAVDFSALFNNPSGSSESRCEQLRALRVREAEYSSGLDTWLATIYSTATRSMEVYTSGQPPAPTHPFDESAASKVSSAIETAIAHTKTKEKLGRVGEKSKSFFAKGRKLVRGGDA